MRHEAVLGILLCALAVGAGCKAKLSSDVTIDGKTFKPSSCRSGQVYGFVGVELKGSDGTRLRVSQTPSNEGVAFLLRPGDKTGVELGKCGQFSVSQQNSTINDVKNVEGKASLDCTAAGHTIKGSVTFENCH